MSLRDTAASRRSSFSWADRSNPENDGFDTIVGPSASCVHHVRLRLDAIDQTPAVRPEVFVMESAHAGRSPTYGAGGRPRRCPPAQAERRVPLLQIACRMNTSPNAGSAGQRRGNAFPDLLTRPGAKTTFFAVIGVGTVDGESAGASDVMEAPVVIGGPSRTRTLDPLIKSPSQPLRTAMHAKVRARDTEGW